MTVSIQHDSFVAFTFLLLHFLVSASSQAALRFERVPDSGIQPQVAVDTAGRTHLLYFKGDAMGGDLFYTVKNSGTKGFGPAQKVNRQPGSVTVAGTMRGPQMALGRDQVHVVWMGGNGAEKVKIGGESVTPLLYTRLGAGSDGFEPERNILTHIAGLDGGQTVAADKNGNVYVIWHGAPPGTEGEEERGLYVARSTDDGKTFAKECKAEVPRKGACACCGLRASVDESGALHVLFRAAESGVNRDELWLKSTDFGKTFSMQHVSPWKIGTCPASSASFSFSKDFAVGAWEDEKGVVAKIAKGGDFVDLRPEGTKKQKHPTLATHPRGEVLLTWVEDAGWGKEGTLACQGFDASGRAMGAAVRKPGLPAWSFGAALAEQDGFVVYY
jgi:hypothetical protein